MRGGGHASGQWIPASAGMTAERPSITSAVARVTAGGQPLLHLFAAAPPEFGKRPSQSGFTAATAYLRS